MDSDLWDIMASTPQSRDRLENRRGKMTRCPEKCGKQWRLVQGKLGWEKQKEEEAKEEVGKKREEKEKRKRQKKGKTMELKKVVEKWEIWDKEEKATRSEEEVKKWVSERFYKSLWQETVRIDVHKKDLRSYY